MTESPRLFAEDAPEAAHRLERALYWFFRGIGVAVGALVGLLWALRWLLLVAAVLVVLVLALS